MPSVIKVRNQKVADFYKLGEMSSIFAFHKGLQIDLERVCTPEESNIADNINEVTKSSLLIFEINKNKMI